MKSTNFKQANQTLARPANMTDEECGSLEVYTDGEQCVSCWRGSLIERIVFLLTGEIWLWVHSGETQPPVVVSVENPWGRDRGVD